MKMVNKINAGAVQTKINILFSFVLFMAITSTNECNGGEDPTVILLKTIKLVYFNADRN